MFQVIPNTPLPGLPVNGSPANYKLWEYEVRIIKPEGAVNAQIDPYSVAKSLGAYLNASEPMTWEVVNVVPTIMGTGYLVTFRRQVAQNAQGGIL